MPTLSNPRYEAFAQARAKGALLIDAYESAGFVRHRDHPSRLAWKPGVAERIAELRKLQTYMEDLTLNGLLVSLGRIIRAGAGSDTPALANAARLAVLDAARLQAELTKARADEQQQIKKDFKDFGASDLADEPPEGRAVPPTTAAPPPPRADPVAPQRAPASAPPAPIQRPKISPTAPAHLLASAAATPLGLPGLSPKAGPLTPRLGGKPARPVLSGNQRRALEFG